MCQIQQDACHNMSSLHAQRPIINLWHAMLHQIQEAVTISLLSLYIVISDLSLPLCRPVSITASCHYILSYLASCLPLYCHASNTASCHHISLLHIWLQVYLHVALRQIQQAVTISHNIWLQVTISGFKSTFISPCVKYSKLSPCFIISGLKSAFSLIQICMVMLHGVHFGAWQAVGL